MKPVFTTPTKFAVWMEGLSGKVATMRQFPCTAYNEELARRLLPDTTMDLEPSAFWILTHAQHKAKHFVVSLIVGHDGLAGKEAHRQPCIAYVARRVSIIGPVADLVVQRCNMVLTACDFPVLQAS